jgi:ferric-dicitrate binding protein FerR (iron transport regulator)
MERNDEMLPDGSEYAFDPAAAADETVASLERLLEPLRYPIDERPLALPPRIAPRRRWRRRLIAAAAIAASLLVSIGGIQRWLWQWPAGQPWKIITAPDRIGDRLAEGELLRLGDDESAVVKVARIGSMEIGPGSAVRLVSTVSGWHQLQMDEGSLAIGVWAPPFTLAITTPAGEIFDLGCAFMLNVTAETTHVHVTSGWVKLENRQGDVLVPAGAASSMEAERIPSVPIFDDAAADFRSAVQRLERGDGTAGDVEQITAAARPRDVFTLLLLAHRQPEDRRTRLLGRAAALAPPPDPELYERARGGDLYAIWDWAQTLDLPPPKGWRRNWRDALPSGRRAAGGQAAGGRFP